MFAIPADSLAVVVLALAIEAAFGYPASVFRAGGHPVTWIGAAIAELDRRLNRATMGEAARRLAGVFALASISVLTGAAAFALQAAALALLPKAFALILLAALASTLIAQRSLWDHVAAVADALEREGVSGGRQAVSRIVGRNPDVLDEAGVARAAIESLAENFSDGVVGPVFWGGVFGLPGAALYKAVNTADSMIGHKTPRHLAFGWAAARVDDWINLPASRLAALWIALAALLHPGADAAQALRAVLRDARKHKSPNAGWPEAAMAGALGLRLAGPRVYGTTRIEDGWMGSGRAEANAADIRRALSLYRTACLIQAAAFGALAAVAI